MKSSEIIRALMESQDIGPTKLADRIGGNCKARTITDRLAMTNISIDKLNEMLRVLDYKIIVVPRDTRLPKDSFEVE